MKLKKLNQKGVAALEIILIIFVIGAVAGIGYYVYQAKLKTNKTLDSTAQGAGDAQKSEKKVEESVKDETADWKTFSSKEGQYSFKHPATWVFVTNPELCNPGLTLMAVNTSALGKCASSSGGQMVISGTEGDSRTENTMTEKFYTSLTDESVTINGLAGKKQTGAYQDTTNQVVNGGLKPGTKTVRYIFYTNNRTYTATYYSANNNTDYPDALKDFSTLVTKTFKFQP